MGGENGTRGPTLKRKPPAMGMYGGGLPGAGTSTGLGFPLKYSKHGSLEIMVEMRRKRRLHKSAW